MRLAGRVLAGSLIFAISYLVVILAATCFEVFVLGHQDEKWGGYWDNLQMGFLLYGALLLPLCCASFVAGALFVVKYRPSQSWRRFATTCALSAVCAAGLALSGLPNWLSTFLDSQSMLPIALLGAIPGAAGALALTLLAPWRRPQQSA